MLLVLVVIPRLVLFPQGSVAILIKQKLAKIVILKMVLDLCRPGMVEGRDGGAKCMDDPFGLKHELGHHRSTMRPHLIQHFLRVVQPPCRVVGDVTVVFRPVVDASLPAGDGVGVLVGDEVGLGRLDSLEIALVLLAVDVVGVLVDAEGVGGCEGERGEARE